jgi:predicted PurR-regulated permease PerM
VVLGELLWGIPGMILFEPLFAIVRIACSHVPALQPFAYLLQDDTPNSGLMQKVKQLVGRKT